MNRAVVRTPSCWGHFSALILFLQYLQSPVNKSKEINYTQFVESVEKGDVKTATFQYEGQTYNVTGELREKDTTYERSYRLLIQTDGFVHAIA